MLDAVTRGCLPEDGMQQTEQWLPTVAHTHSKEGAARVLLYQVVQDDDTMMTTCKKLLERYNATGGAFKSL